MTVIPVKISATPPKPSRQPNITTQNIWVIEASESTIRNPHFLVGVSKGRCFFLWDDNFHLAKKFNSEIQAYAWTRDNRLLCGYRVACKTTTKQTRRL